MQLQVLPQAFSVCKVPELPQQALEDDFCFVGKTDEELSLVCATDRVPANALERDDGWRAFRIVGVLDFSLIGILADISATLANAQVGIFAVSTFNTDYILLKAENLDRARKALTAAGHDVAKGPCDKGAYCHM